jgi:hypothetical protein
MLQFITFLAVLLVIDFIAYDRESIAYMLIKWFLQ